MHTLAQPLHSIQQIVVVVLAAYWVLDPHSGTCDEVIALDSVALWNVEMCLLSAENCLHWCKVEPYVLVTRLAYFDPDLVDHCECNKKLIISHLYSLFFVWRTKRILTALLAKA